MPEVERLVAHVDAVDETDGRIEVLLDLPRAHAPAPADTARPAYAEAEGAILLVRERRAGPRVEAGVIRLLIPGLPFEQPVTLQSRVAIAKVGARHAAVVIRLRVAVRHDHAHSRLAEHVRRNARDERVVALDGLEVVLLDRQRAEVPA